MRRFARRKLSLPQQKVKMAEKYPSFKFKSGGWKGTLQPTVNSPKYNVKIQSHPFRPRVFILFPQLKKGAPHMYPDGSLCLYYPSDKSFNDLTFIADTIVPWTAEWLYFYEVWLEEDIWWGKEAPHDVRKL
jgi:hypothetical protein